MNRREKIQRERDEEMLREFLLCECGQCWKRPWVIWDETMTKVVIVIAAGGEA